MDYSKIYKDKLTTSSEAVKVVNSGNWIDYGWVTSTPIDLDKALANRIKELNDINIRGGILLQEPEIFKIDNPQNHFTWNSWHMGGIERRAIEKGFCFYSPMRYSEMPRYYRDLPFGIDVAMFQVSPMDEDGFFNFGPNCSHMKAMIERAKYIIVEVNTNMPYCYGFRKLGDNRVHITEVTHIVEGSNTNILQLLSKDNIADVDKKIAEIIVNEIPNGACLQLGIGGLPDAAGKLIAQSDLKDLGIHTEMYTDAFVEMAISGKVTGNKKNINTGYQVYAFAAGSNKLYEYINNNPNCIACPVDYTNNASVIASLDNFISINNAVEVDLFGQVSSESSGLKHISGAGGQLDFVIGAYLSKGGKSFICLSSTIKDKNGNVFSRIVPTFKDGTIITDTRANTHYIVTEYGKVNLKGLTTWQKAEAIISIAHPDFRDELIKKATEQKIWRKSNKI